MNSATIDNGADQSDELLVGFIDESIDSLQELPGQLEEHRQNPGSGAINPVFRAVHSIKGNAGFFGLTAIKKFSHSLENTLDEVRNGQVQLSEDLQRAFVEGFDVLDEMLQRVLDGDVDQDLRQQDTEMLERVGKLADQTRAELSPEQKIASDLAALAEEIAQAGVEQSQQWADRLRKLCTTGEGEEEQAEAAQEESGPAFKPADFAEVTCTAAGQDVSQHVTAILELFTAFEKGEYSDEVAERFFQASDEFASWAESAQQPELAAVITGASTDFKTIFNSPFDVDANLISIVWDALCPELAKMRPQQEAPKTEQPQDAGEGEAEKKEPSEKKDAKAKSRLLRVKEECVDAFMDDVSGLFITCERLKDLQRRMAGESQIGDLVDEMRQINAALAEQTNDLQQSVVTLRKVPVRGLFSKFPRVARSLATKLGKKLDVHLVGEDIEIDKSLVEDLDAPLMHMVRNVCDHAIEPPEERIERGISEVGNLWLKCEITRTHVVITIQDDGRGIDAERLRRKAVEKGVLSEMQADLLSHEEALDLVFHPGFSTAEKVSDVSGRGVGMDVVRTNLREHDAEIHIDSKVGVGTTFTLEIPVRQAVLVIDGLLLQSGPDQFVVPFENILEIVDLLPGEIKTVHGEGVATIRGEPFAAVDVGRLLDIDSQLPTGENPIPGVLIGGKDGSACLLVDRVLGQRKVVVNSLDKILPGTDKIAGVAQLGGGRLALVLSAPDLLKSLSELQAV